MGFHRLLERWNCREIDKWESPGGVGSDRDLCARSPPPLLVFKELVCAGGKPQGSREHWNAQHLLRFVVSPFATMQILWR